MKCPHVFVDAPLTVGARLHLQAQVANHLRVLRLRVGDTLDLFNGDGCQYPARLLELERREALVEVAGRVGVERESSLRLTLVQGISKGDRMDYTIQKAVELGASRIVPVFTKRSVVQLTGDRLNKRHEHWTGVMIAACEQSGRNRLPELLPPQSLSDAWDSLAAGERLVLDPLGEVSLREVTVAETARAITLLIGPEGGLTEQEIETAAHHGFRRLRLGPRVLRTETAGVAALSALQALYGDLG